MLLAELVGRPVGILVAVGLALAAGLHFPGRMGWRELVVVAFATSVGFAIALFFATGVLATGPVLSEAKIGVLGSVVGVLLAFAPPGFSRSAGLRTSTEEVGVTRGISSEVRPVRLERSTADRPPATRSRRVRADVDRRS